MTDPAPQNPYAPPRSPTAATTTPTTGEPTWRRSLAALVVLTAAGASLLFAAGLAALWLYSGRRSLLLLASVGPVAAGAWWLYAAGRLRRGDRGISWLVVAPLGILGFEFLTVVA